MQTHDIKKPKQKKKRRVGRGGKRGTFSGRGVKGQKARAGHNIRPQILDYIFKIPKATGPTSKGQNKGHNVRGGGVMGSQNVQPVFTINTGDLQSVVKKGDVVDPEFLVKKKLVAKHKGRVPKNIKLLGKGELKKEITVKGLKLSASARQQIEKAGGKIE
ncbi:MAG: uL15m family ribosomal protein [Candidatus Spechtbacterales bacterium]|nr:uL15m family ribosomal protein [Candidatus Spechtbacterales bacterium]